MGITKRIRDLHRRGFHRRHHSAYSRQEFSDGQRWLVFEQKQRGQNKKGLLRPRDQPPGENTDEATVLDVSDYQPPRIPSKTWRELIKKIWEVDPLSCPRCGHEMKIISLIHEPGVIQRILRHLGLWKEQSDPHERKIKTPVDGPVVLEDFVDGLRLVKPTARRAGPDMNNPPSTTTEVHDCS